MVRVYQPLSNLHRPVLIDPQLPNFQDLNLTVRCVPGGLLSPQEAGALCQKVGLLFENQGARVTTTTGLGDDDLEPQDTGAEPTEDAGEDGAEGAEPVDPPARTDLTLELRARKINSAVEPISWLLCGATFTLLPAVTESTFAQDVVIRDGTGFLLVSESLEGRIVSRFGAGPWLGNKVLDIWRDKPDRLTGDAVKQDLSTDLYRQLSQMLFNAKMHWEVLQQGPRLHPSGPTPRSPSAGN